MPRITYLQTDATLETLEVKPGTSVMRAAILAGVNGIVGECGGQAMCATCHVFVEEVSEELHAPNEDEEEMLECTAVERSENSRLSCQLVAGKHFESITVRLPESQV